MDVAGQMLEEDVEIRFLPLRSPEAQALGAELAPALVVNRRALVEGVPTVEEIRELIQKARAIRLGIILTKSPQGSDEAESALEAGAAALKAGDQAALFLLSDGVWAAKKGPLAEKVAAFLDGGGEVYVSGEHLRAAGLGPEKLLAAAVVADDALGRLVDLVMDQWDKVIVF